MPIKLFNMRVDIMLIGMVTMMFIIKGIKTVINIMIRIMMIMMSEGMVMIIGAQQNIHTQNQRMYR